MNAAENDLFPFLIGKPSLQAATIEELEKLVHQHPYFSVAQLLLTKKLKAVSHTNFAQQFAKCSLFFSDAHWLHSQLYLNETAIEPTIIAEENAERANVQVVEKEAEPLSEIQQISQSENINPEDSNLITLPAEDALSSISLQLGDVAEEDELPPANDEETALPENMTELASAKIANLLHNQAEDFKVPAGDNSQLAVNPEPFYTIDYFASQGIKADLHSQDVLAKKVHKFTDWLKQMKRINQSPADLGSDPEMETFVQSIANTSNQPKDIFTEAMAEVLVKQGKRDKAIQVYNKLSLLNPAKTAYFAAKIHQLKDL